MQHKHILNKYRNPKKIKNTLYLTTNKCNRNCDFCFYKENHWIKSNIDKNILLKNKFDKIYLTGGEPLYDGGILELLKEYLDIHKNLNELFIFTNGDHLNKLNDEYSDILDKINKIDIVVNSGNTLFDNKYIKHLNITIYNKIFLNNRKYVNLIKDIIDDIIENKNIYIILSFIFPSDYSNVEYEYIYKKYSKWYLNKDIVEYLVKNMKGRIFSFDTTDIIKRIHIYLNKYDIYDSSIYYPYYKPIKSKIGSCSKCKFKDDYGLCLENIMKDNCPRIPSKCFSCEYRDVCFFTYGKINLLDYNRLECDKFLKPLYEIFVKHAF